VAVGTVIGFPHGANATEVKCRETEQACREGAVEIDVVINIGKALDGDWSYVGNELRALTEETHRHGALIKVIFETDFVTDDAKKIRLCEICEQVGADFVKTSTGFGFARQADGQFRAIGATAHDVALMRAHVSAKVRVKASGGIRNLDDLVAMRDLGAARCGTSATAPILDEFRQRESGVSNGRHDSADVTPSVSTGAY
jgi:deoxyribose-phosphate aldolase